MQKSRSHALLEKLQQKARERQNQSSKVELQFLTEEEIKQKNDQKKRKPNKNSSQEHALTKKSRLDEVSSPDLDSDPSDDGIMDKTKERGAKNRKRNLSGSLE